MQLLHFTDELDRRLSLTVALPELGVDSFGPYRRLDPLSCLLNTLLVGSVWLALFWLYYLR